MHKHLYEVFKHWYRGGSIYIYSDPHFSDLDSYKLRFKALGIKLEVIDHDDTIEMLDQIQIKNINQTCTKKDTLIILGDVGNIECVKKLKAGYKILVMGNHDKGASNYKDGFDEVYEGTLQISPKIMLSHEPVEYPCCLNIHGHVHGINPLGAYTEGINCASHYNCCAEQINYTPVSLKFIVESGMLKNIKDIHRKTIDDRQSKKENSK